MAMGGCRVAIKMELLTPGCESSEQVVKVVAAK
jgi:hypothetical protein